MTAENKDLQMLIDEFMLTIEASGNVESEKTVRWNRRKMQLFAKFIQEEHISDPLTSAAFLKYAIYLKQRPRFDNKEGPLSVYYRHGCIQVLKRFGSWLYEKQYTDVNLGDPLNPPRLPTRPKIKSIGLNDMAKMIDSCQSLRDKAAMMTLRDTGCRVQEIINMRWRDVDLERGEIVVTGKMNATRTVYLSSPTVDALAEYKKIVPHGNDEPVWWGNLGRKNTSPLSYRGFYMMMYRLAQRSGIDGRWNPHSWRHAYGRNMTRNGCPTAALAQLMGHTTERVTGMYSTMDDPELKSTYHKYSPYDPGR